MDNGFQETMISTPKPISHSLSSKSLLYLNSRSLSSCGDLYLVSNDGFYFEINSAVFASVSGLSSVIRERADEFMILVTEVGQENLAKILLFCVSGVIRDVGDLSNPEVLQAFESLGIQLNTLNLSQERHNPAFEIHSPGAVPCQTLRAKLNVRPVPQKIVDDGFNALPFKVKSEPLDEDYTIGSADILRFLDSRKGRLNHGKDDNGEDNISLESGEGVEAVYYNEDSDPSEPEPTKRKRKRKAQPAKPADPNKPKRVRNRKKEKLTSSETPVYYEGDRNLSLRLQCPDCNYGTDTADEFRKHQKQFHTFVKKEAHLRLRVYNCLLCEVLITQEGIYGHHYKTEHKGHCYKCFKCGRTFRRSTMEFVNHSEEHVNEHIHARKCVHCGLNCKNQRYERQHMNRWGPFHTKACIQCNVPVSTWEEHVMHVRDKHDNIWIWRCGRCEKTFDDKSDLTVHRREHESPHEGKICDLCGKTVRLIVRHKEVVHATMHCPCTVCDKVFKHPSALQTHMEHHNMGQSKDAMSTICGTCGEQFATPMGLNQHIKINHSSEDDKTFKCRYCPKKFFTNSQKITHEHCSHLKPHGCQQCQKRFPTKEERDHHRDGGLCSAILKCNVCSKILSSQKHLRYHMINKHAPTDQKPFKCPHCDKGFALKGKLAEHINCHTNEKPFQCRFCELAFRNLSSRNYHEKTVHPDLFETIRRKYEKRKRPAKIEVDETLIE